MVCHIYAYIISKINMNKQKLDIPCKTVLGSNNIFN